MKKVKSFWSKESLLIPNVFRLAKCLEGEEKFLFEHQDLSKKELLVSNYCYKQTGRKLGRKLKSVSCEASEDEEENSDEDE